MSKGAMTEVIMQEKSCLLDTPYEVLLEIFRTLSRSKLNEISRLCSKFRHVADDTRLWKDVFIIYGSKKEYPYNIFAFEDLYSGPSPVKVIELSRAKINPPVSLQTEQMVKVEKLNLASVTANKVTIAAILAKYQCTELYLDGDISKVDPEALFAKQTALEVLSIFGAIDGINHWLTSILKHCKNLKTLDIMYGYLFDTDMLDFANHLPSSLEKLFVHPPTQNRLVDSFFRLLAEKTPNLRELKRLFPSSVKRRSLRKLQFLEALHVSVDPENSTRDLPRDLHTYLVKFPALRTVYLVYYQYLEDPETELETLRKSLQPHDVAVVGITGYPEWPPYPKDGDLWNVSKPM